MTISLINYNELLILIVYYVFGSESPFNMSITLTVSSVYSCAAIWTVFWTCGHKDKQNPSLTIGIWRLRMNLTPLLICAPQAATDRAWTVDTARGTAWDWRRTASLTTDLSVVALWFTLTSRPAPTILSRSNFKWVSEGKSSSLSLMPSSASSAVLSFLPPGSLLTKWNKIIILQGKV